MSRPEKLIAAGTVALVVLILVLDALAPREPDWRPSYTRYTNEPYACGLVYDRLGDLFPQGVTTVREPLYATAQQRLMADSTRPPVNHILIEDGLRLNQLDLQHLLLMVQQGDDAFIASEGFDGLLADSLGIAMAYRWGSNDTVNTINDAKALLFAHPDSLRFTVWPLRQRASSVFIRGDLRHSFSRFPTDSMQVLAVNQREEPVLLRMGHGAGHLYLCSVPLAFTNYYLLKDAGRSFMAEALDLLPDRPVLWDEYYKVGREGSRSPLRYILAQPALHWAYWTAIAMLVLTVLVQARRRQRAIPVVQPPRNTTRDFADTIGRLYYFRGDHADIARKLAGQFKDEVRRTLRLNHTAWDGGTLQEIAARTGISEGEWAHAARLIDHYLAAEHVSQEQLLQFNKTLSGLRARL